MILHEAARLIENPIPHIKSRAERRAIVRRPGRDVNILERRLPRDLAVGEAEASPW